MAFKPIQDKEPSQGSCIGHVGKLTCQPERVELLRGLFVFPQRKELTLWTMIKKK